MSQGQRSGSDAFPMHEYDLARRPTLESLTGRPASAAERRSKRLERSRPVGGKTMEGIKTVDSSLGASNIRIANRRLVTTNLLHCLALDVRLSCFDMHAKTDRLATCAGTVTYIWDLRTLDVIARLGKGNAIHKDTIRHCCFDPTGNTLVTCGDDRRIAIWNVQKQRTERVIEHHLGPVYQVAFAGLDWVVSCSEDGTAVIWDVHTGNKVHDFMKHPSAVRCIAIQPMRPERILTGSNDGTSTAWDVNRQDVIDVIMPDPSWGSDFANPSITWQDDATHHSGSIICMSISPSSLLLATGSLDHTCKLWAIASYLKSPAAVANERLRERQVADIIGRAIRVDDESSDQQAPQFTGKYKDGEPIMEQENTEFRVGEVPLASGYHSDLLFTYRHEAPVLCVAFNRQSNIVITGSADSTCRLWSARRGDLLFQINTPSPVSAIHIDDFDRLFCICLNRLMIFQFHASSKAEAEIENPEKNNTILVTESPPRPRASFMVPDISEPADVPTIPMEMESHARYISDEDEEMEDENSLEPARLPPSHLGPTSTLSLGSSTPQLSPQVYKKKKMTLPDIRRLVSHGITLKSFVDSLVAENQEDFDKDQLEKNMKTFGLTPKKLLRALVNHSFSPKDLFKALAAKRGADNLFGLIQQETSISSHMLRLGYQSVDEMKIIEEEDNDEALAPQSMSARPSAYVPPPHEVHYLEPFSGGVRGHAAGASPRHSRTNSTEPPQQDTVRYSVGRQSVARQSVARQSVAAAHDEYEQDEADDWEYEHDAMDHDAEDDVPYEGYWTKQPRRVRRAVGSKVEGNIVRFIPSEQIKLIKDVQAQRPIQPVFKSNVAVETAPAAVFPNFRPDADIRDQRPARVRTDAAPFQRLNEMTGYKKLGIENFIKGRHGKTAQPRSYGSSTAMPLRTTTTRRDVLLPTPPPYNPPAATGRTKQQLPNQKWDSGSVFFPERYLQSTGMNVEFDGGNSTVRVQPVVMRGAPRDGRAQFPVGQSSQVRVRFNEI
ncbi:hypothetical protein SmJEL517_g04755 [Synchytrium microbalum]|uniref:Anaphase-promoting complex subunit 4 WD40 domain-containing protein n=1 Tax=Synchytrium microbalum TaxID=1806994 RepID=A0A507BQN5_9FUNG|nr:uncharacterized protein SmJEL517_g04755 [Synchytrium microbalum]TPX32090.1 hypothetical protein SmJEL517_g04755 [Synchytrium microbalum]